jgi:SAM-dependent methyltransferase
MWLGMSAATDVVHELYASGENVRPRFQEASAREHFARFVNFVDANAPCRAARILDVGCGGGWSTLLLRERGHRAHGMDLHNHRLDAAALAPDLPYTQGDAQTLPFEDGSFDVVSMHEVLEHVPLPQRALTEAMRVLRPGGRLIVVGPNLLSSAAAAYWALRHTARVLGKGQLWERRTPDLPRHPGGNTMPESWVSLARNVAWTAQKLVQRGPDFRMREPDSRPPFHADNDACYLCNPVDLVKWAEANKETSPRRWWAADRRFARALWPFLGGTWVVIEKHGAAS